MLGVFYVIVLICPTIDTVKKSESLLKSSGRVTTLRRRNNLLNKGLNDMSLAGQLEYVGNEGYPPFDRNIANALLLEIKQGKTLAEAIESVKVNGLTAEVVYYWRDLDSEFSMAGDRAVQESQFALIDEMRQEAKKTIPNKTLISTNRDLLKILQSEKYFQNTLIPPKRRKGILVDVKLPENKRIGEISEAEVEDTLKGERKIAASEDSSGELL